MKKDNPPLEVEAFLWNGKTRLSGRLVLGPTTLAFEADGFHSSHLGLEIDLADIVKLESFLLYDIARKGLKITARNGREGQFIIPDFDVFYRKLKEAIEG
ncbi:MAG: hypothetical protein H6556_09270 [Lewinellaceae bacterium]|nr:hypothetical protein [Lewinellaceae bacterium]